MLTMNVNTTETTDDPKIRKMICTLNMLVRECRTFQPAI